MSQGWTGKDFKAWRDRVGYSLAQAAHVLDIDRRTVTRLQEDDAKIDARTSHLCDSVEMLKHLRAGAFGGNAMNVVLHHHAALIQRMEEADRIGSAGAPTPAMDVFDLKNDELVPTGEKARPAN